MPKTATSWKPGQSGNPKGGPGRPKIVIEVQEMARLQMPDAIATLTRICKDTTAPHAAQVSAAVALLDRGYGRPHQSMDVAVNRSMDEMSDVELLAIVNGPRDDEEKPAAVN